MEPIVKEPANAMAQLTLSMYGSTLCLESLLWDLTSGTKQGAYPMLFNAINQDDLVEATLEALLRIESRFTFLGLHPRATQCRTLMMDLKMLWEEHGTEELFSLYVRQGWTTEGRREPDITIAMGLEYLSGEQTPPIKPLWELRHDPEGRTYDKPIYRMLSSKVYLQDFWDHGKLRISTLAACKRHEGLQGDKSEGEVAVWTGLPNGTTIISGYGVGMDAYILCGTVANTKENRKTFHAENTGAIVITDPYGFGLDLGAAIPHVKYGHAGYCDYWESRVIHLEDGTDSAAIYASIDFVTGKGLDKFRNITPGEEVFVKEKEPFAAQEEFRFAWFTSKPIDVDYVEIVCPEAREFCKPAWFE
ncbi:MAG TPA: hypothetical protein PLV70_08135 [Flavobacteriales bacterium]|nr:hypothetical protein [Flavobacteriales bacterium]